MSEHNAFPSAGRQPNFADFLPKRSAGLKLLLVCALALIMTIPALLVHSIVYERSAGFDQAVRDVSESAGGPQYVLGPVLTVPYSFTPNPKKPDTLAYGIAVAYAETGTAASSVAVEEKQRGIHTVPVYLADIQMEAEFSPSALRAAVPQGAEPVWRDARLYVGVSDTRGIKDAIDVTVDGRPVTLGPASSFRSGDGYSIVPNAAVTLAAGQIENLATLERPVQVAVNPETERRAASVDRAIRQGYVIDHGLQLAKPEFYRRCLARRAQCRRKRRRVLRRAGACPIWLGALRGRAQISISAPSPHTISAIWAWSSSRKRAIIKALSGR